jgi:hypothetical protein
MKNISKFILTFFIAVPLVFAFGTQTVKRIDEIKNNTGTDIVLNPNDSVKINYFDGGKALQSSPNGDLAESAVTNTELGFVSGVTSSIQTQINAKQDALTGVDGDLYYHNSGLSNLAIGTSGQILQVSALGFPEWVDLPPAVSVTTKGDLQTYSTEADRLPVGTDGQVLQANSATSTGLEWVDADFYTSPLTTEGDLLYRDATQDTRLAIGGEGQLLTVTSGVPSWQDAPISLPDQTGNAGLYLTTNGSTASWNEVNRDVNEIKDNLLECAGFDACAYEGTITNGGAAIDLSGATTRTLEAAAYNTSKLNLTQSAAETLDYTYTKTANFDGKQMVAYCEIKNNSGASGVTFSVGANGTEQGSLDVSTEAKWKYYKIPFVGGDTSQYFSINHSDTGTVPDIDVDNCFIGKASNEIRNLGQAHFVGSVTYKDNDCNWERSSATYGTLITPVLNACFANEVIGNVVAPSPSDNPFITIPNFRTDGYYQIIHQGLKYNDGNSGTCYFNISKDANESNNSAIWVSATDGDGDNHLTADIRFNQGETGNVQIIAKNSGGTECSVRGQTEISSSWSVYFYPDDTSTIVTQDTELTAKTDNVFVATVDTAGVVSGENHDWINGNCTIDATPQYNCPLNNLKITGGMNCRATPITFTNRVPIIQTTTTSNVGVRFRNYADSGYGTATFFLECTKKDTDYNKSATIVGKFEQVEEVNTVLDAKTANVFSFSMTDTGIVSNDSYDFINGNCTRINNSTYYTYNCPLNDLNITQRLICSPASHQGAGLYLVAQESLGSSTTNIQLTGQFSSANTILATAADIICHKSDVDLNKDVKGVIIQASKSKQEIADIVREDIVSSDLCMVDARGNPAQSTTGSIDILFNQNEVKDNCNAWNGSSFTAPRDMRIMVSGQIQANATFNGYYNAHINGTLTKAVSDAAISNNQRNFSVTVDLLKDDVFSIRPNNPVTMAGAEEFHHISITESADTESIVKNLSNQKVECQTKSFQSSSITGTGVIAALTFNNLDTSKYYSLNSKLGITHTTSSLGDKYTYIGLNGVNVPLGYNNLRDTSTGAMWYQNVFNLSHFKPTSTSIEHNVTLIQNTAISYGYATLCELPSTFVETSKFD